MPASDMKVTLLNHMGDDLTIVNAARVSFDQESSLIQIDQDGNECDLQYPPGSYEPAYLLAEGEELSEPCLSKRDAKLVNYLGNHNHWTTFGHCAASFRVKAPIFVARQLVKHQVGLVWNEVSRRYVDGTPEYWLPAVLKCRPDGSIKQGAGKEHDHSAHWIYLIERQVKAGVSLYDEMIADGVAPEQARIVLSLNTMTEWYWTGSLAAWARVCNLRLDPHAQEETREVAEAFSVEMRKLFPVAWNALVGEK